MPEDIGARALHHFDSGLYCAESVLLAMCEALDADCASIPRVATGLCSGMARSGGMCGAVSGAILAIGLAVGRDTAQDSVEPAYSEVSRLLEEFEERHGSTCCSELLECDLGTEEGQKIFEEENRIERCRKYVQDAGRILQNLAGAACE